MTQVLAPELTAPLDTALDAATETIFSPYSRSAPLLLLMPIALAMLSMAVGGVGMLNDLSMISLSAICVGFCVHALWVFPRRYGIGPLIIYGGTLIWYCHDYMKNWLGADYGMTDFSADLIAKHNLLIALFAMFCGFGLTISAGRTIVKWMQRIPESPSPGVYFTAAVVMCLIGILPYFLFVQEPFYVAILKDMFAMRAEGGATWTIARSGNLNYNFEAYWLRLLDLGTLSGVIAAMYAIWLARSTATRVISWGIFALWAMLAFGTGTRGALVQVAMPAIAMLYLRYQAEAAAFLKKFSARAYIYCAIVGIPLFVMVQYQGSMRNTSAEDRVWNQVQMGAVLGNDMYTEGLTAVQLVPAQHAFFRNDFPGEGAVLVFFDTAVEFALHPIPRALWPDKPVNEAWGWYNHAFGGGSETEGATFTPGIAAWEYILYGYGGVISMGLLFGWLVSVVERSFQLSVGQPAKMVFCLALANGLFGAFRTLQPSGFFPIFIGMACFVILLWVLRKISPAQANG